LQLDNINFLPDFVICIIFLSGILMITGANPDIKNRKLNFYLVVNIFISACSYFYGMFYKLESAKNFTGENLGFLLILKIIYNISYHISIILFFLIFMEFYKFIKNFQRKNLEFSVRYYNKYLTASEKNIDKNKNIILRIAAAAFCVKTISPVLPQSGTVFFCHSMILTAFVVFVIKGLDSIKDAIYSYYN